MFICSTFVTGGLKSCGLSPSSVMWGFGTLGGSGGFTISCTNKR